MNGGIFFNLTKCYLKGAKSGFFHLTKISKGLKFIYSILWFIYAIALILVSIIFGLLIFIDYIGVINSKFKRITIKHMDTLSLNVSNSMFSFLLSPVLLALMSLLLLITFFFPNASNNAVIQIAQDQVLRVFSGEGAFKKCNRIVNMATHKIFDYVPTTTVLLLKPIYGLIAAFYSSVLIFISAIFLVLIPLDWVGRYNAKNTKEMINMVHNQQQLMEKSVWAFLLSPLILLAFTPFVLFFIIVTRFNSNLGMEE